MDVDKFTLHNARGNCIARPALCAFLYSDRTVHELASFAADAIEHYMAYIGPDVLKTYVGNNGELRDFSSRKLAKDLKQLRSFPTTLGASWIEYDSDPDGWVGEYGVLLYATDFSAYEFERESANLLRLDFPPDFLQTHGLDSFIEFIIRVATSFPFESGNVGYAFKRTSGTKGNATRAVNRLLPRYLGFDPCYQDAQDSMRGHTFCAHWINLINDRLSTDLGGFDSIAQQLSGADVRRIANGIIIRGCKTPPIGDANRQAPDIGWLPEVARILRPTRIDLSGLGEPDFDPAPWLARFDDMQVRPWDQSK